jgi:hypothetical protein
VSSDANDIHHNPPKKNLLYVALYDYIVNIENHLNINKGDHIYVLNWNKSLEWCEVRSSKNPNKIGWVPTSYITPATAKLTLNTNNPNSTQLLQSYSWFHGRIERVKAEYLLSSGMKLIIKINLNSNSSLKYF